MRLFLYIGILAATLLPTLSMGDIRESGTTLFGLKQENLIIEASGKGIGPSSLSGNQVYVIAYIGAAYSSVLRRIVALRTASS